MFLIQEKIYILFKPPEVTLIQTDFLMNYVLCNERFFTCLRTNLCIFYFYGERKIWFLAEVELNIPCFTAFYCTIGICSWMSIPRSAIWNELWSGGSFNIYIFYNIFTAAFQPSDLWFCLSTLMPVQEWTTKWSTLSMCSRSSRWRRQDAEMSLSTSFLPWTPRMFSFLNEAFFLFFKHLLSASN